MKTLYKGIYSGCPIELAPTGYLLWCLDNNFMENILADIYTELKKRKQALDESLSITPKPMSDTAWLTYSWFENWNDETQTKFMSMVYNDSVYLTPTSKRFTKYYNNILEKLLDYEQTNDIKVGEWDDELESLYGNDVWVTFEGNEEEQELKELVKSFPPTGSSRTFMLMKRRAEVEAKKQELIVGTMNDWQLALDALDYEIFTKLNSFDIATLRKLNKGITEFAVNLANTTRK